MLHVNPILRYRPLVARASPSLSFIYGLPNIFATRFLMHNHYISIGFCENSCALRYAQFYDIIKCSYNLMSGEQVARLNRERILWQKKKPKKYLMLLRK